MKLLETYMKHNEKRRKEVLESYVHPKESRALKMIVEGMAGGVRRRPLKHKTKNSAGKDDAGR
ncbi:MAG: hypothetical protein ACI4WY_10375 [Anaerovoracaceae bacterium]